MHKVLLVDDSKTILYTLDILLNENFSQITIFKALNGSEALQIIQEKEIDLIISDVYMPKMSGIEFARELQKIPKAKHIPLILTSAVKKEEADKLAGFETGAIDFLEKPINETLFIAKLKVFFNLISTQKALKEEHNMLETILDTQDSIIFLANDKEVFRANKAFSRIFGFENLEDFFKKHQKLSDIFLEKEGVEYLRKEYPNLSWIEYVLHNPKHLHEVYIKDQNEKEKVFRVTCSQTSKDLFIVTFSDVTLLKVQEKIQEQKLRQETMKEMLSMVAHQWRQPLSTLSVSISRILLKQTLGKLDDTLLKTTLNQAEETISSLSEKIKEFQDSFTQTKYKKEVKLVEEIQKVWGLLKGKAEVLHVEFSIENELKNDVFYLYHSSLNTILFNIFTNSLEALEKKEKKFLHVKLYEEHQNVVVLIEDSGGGVAKEELGKIFEPYFSTKSKNSRGLGLYMVQNLIYEDFKGEVVASNGKNGLVLKLSLSVKE